MEFGPSGAVQLASSSLACRRPAPHEPLREAARELDSVMESGLSFHRNYVYILPFRRYSEFLALWTDIIAIHRFGGEVYLSLFKFFSVLPFIMVNKDIGRKWQNFLTSRVSAAPLEFNQDLWRQRTRSI